jgi:hypothetical protein
MYHYMKYSIVLYVVYFVYFMRLYSFVSSYTPAEAPSPIRDESIGRFPLLLFCDSLAGRTGNLVTYDIRAVSVDCFWTT